MERPLLKIYGERNTGTNYLSRLINLNLDVNLLSGVVPRSVLFLQRMLPGNELVRDIYFFLTFSRNLGWKHTLVNPTELQQFRICSRTLSFVTLTKNPYSWLLSLYKRPYHQYSDEKEELIAFLTSSWQTVGRENCKMQDLDPVGLWNIKNLSYLSLSNSFPTLNIKFEDLLANPEQIMNLIGETFSYVWSVDKFRNYNQSTKGENKDSNFYRDYYLNERWKEKLSSQALAIINERLDDHLMKNFGYEKLS